MPCRRALLRAVLVNGSGDKCIVVVISRRFVVFVVVVVVVFCRMASVDELHMSTVKYRPQRDDVIQSRGAACDDEHATEF